MEKGIPQLLIVEKNNKLKCAQLSLQQISVGRKMPDSSCNIQLDSNLVSANHGMITRYNGNYYYNDGINTNGTFYNGKLISKAPGQMSSAIMLEDGDTLSIGDEGMSERVIMIFSTTTGGSIWRSYLINGIQKEILIGRDKDKCDIVLPQVVVSRLHAIIKYSPNGLTIVDNKSQNGLIVNGERVIKEAKLKSGDVILIGTTKIILINNVLLYNIPKPVEIKSIYVPKTGTDNPTTDVNNDTGSVVQPPREAQAREGGAEIKCEHISRTVKCKKGTGINGSDKKNILDDVSLTIHNGELVAILGGSGAGKTTFMNCINGFEPATSGTVLMNGSDLYKNYQVHKSSIGYVPQQDIVHDNLTLEDMLTYTGKLRLPSDITKQELQQRVTEVMEMVDLLPQKDTYIKKLSGGQRKRASIAVELISDPPLCFLDEPTSGLDPEAETNLMHQLRNLSTEKGKTVIVITHTLQNIHLFDKIIFLAPGGKLCFYGTPDEGKKFFEVDNLADAYEKISDNVDFYVNKYRSSVKSEV